MEDSNQARIMMAQAMLDSGVADDRNRPREKKDFTENAVRVLERRYLVKDSDKNPLENPDGMFRRVSGNLAQADQNYLDQADQEAVHQAVQQTEQEFYQTMSALLFLPNSPTLMNAGATLQQLSACFVLPVEDSLDHIFGQVKQTALIHKSGGGTGFSFSRLRPKGDLVGSTGGVASGPVGFIRAFDTATDVVKQGGTRRGANMAILNVDHPDILEFIHSKDNMDMLENFNISVAVTDDFMEAVRTGGTFSTVNPRNGQRTGTLDAREVWEQIISSAHKTGDPGLMFIDAVNRENPNPHLGAIESTNPCFAGAVRLATNLGLLTFEELNRTQSEIRVTTDNRVQDAGEQREGSAAAVAVAPRTRPGTQLRDAVPVFKTRVNWPVFTLTTQRGYQVTATEDHRFHTPQGPRELRSLEPGEEVLIQSGQGAWSANQDLPPFPTTGRLRARVQRGEASPPTRWSAQLGQLMGWITGDGWFTQSTPREDTPAHTVGLTFRAGSRGQAARFQDIITNWLGTNASVTEQDGALTLRYGSSLHHLLAATGMQPATPAEREVPASLWAAPREAVTGFISALCTAASTVHTPSHGQDGPISIASSSGKLLQQVQLLLLNEGIVSTVHHGTPAGASSEPTQHHQEGLHQLSIDGPSRGAFLDRIGLLAQPDTGGSAQQCSTGPAEARAQAFTDQVKSIEFAGIQDVYCTTEPQTHSIVANGFVATQCGEQPLLPNESCNLGSINLARMVRYDRSGTAHVDRDLLEEVCTTAVHMMDNVIDVNLYPADIIGEVTRSTRRIGIGVMGWADLLVQLGIPYDSQEARDLAKTIMSAIQQNVHRASADLARTRGPYPEWLPQEHGGDDAVPVRNTAPTTIAPTGTISIIAGVSSGIEPLFGLSYVRNVMDGTHLVEVNPYFQAAARAGGFHSQKLMETIAQTGSIQDSPDVPQWAKDIFKVASDISPEDHVLMQAAWQKYTDNAVSKTINFPNSATLQDIKTAYQTAHETNCKGITVYRDGSHEDQVLSTGQTGQQRLPLTPSARERPRVVRGQTERVRSGHGNVYITTNFHESDTPFEVFCAVGKAGGCDSAQLEAVSRLASMALRSGIDPQEIIDNLKGITCCPSWDEGILVRSVPDALARGLSRAIDPDGDPTSQDAWNNLDPIERRHRERLERHGPTICPDCGSDIVYQEGCRRCVSPRCGWSECE